MDKPTIHGQVRLVLIKMLLPNMVSLSYIKGEGYFNHLWLSQLGIVFIPFQLYPCTLPLNTNNYNVKLVYFTLCTWKDSDHISCLYERCLQ